MNSKVDAKKQEWFLNGQKYGNSDEILDSVAKFRWYILEAMRFS